MERIPYGKRVRTVRLLPAGTTLAPSNEDGWVRVAVPRVYVHEAVDVEPI